MHVFRVPEDGPLLRSEQDALDVMGMAYGEEAEIIAIPVARLDPDFFRLSTRVAGLFLQKLTNYGQRVAIVGDIGEWVAESNALRDFVTESNRRGAVLFVDDASELESR